MDIRFTRIALELLSTVNNKEDIKFDQRFVNYFMRYTIEERTSIYEELRQVIKTPDNDFTEYNYTKKFNKDEINAYLKDFCEFIEINKLYQQ